MELVYLLSGGAPIVKRFLASAAIDNAGIVLEADDAAAGSGVGGVSLPAASAVGGPSVGICIDTVSSFPDDPDAQVNADADVFVSVIVNPAAVYRAKMSGSSTADTALASFSPDAADSLGENVSDSATTAVSGGAVWGLSGGNSGIVRRADTTDPRVAVSFPNAIATSDVYSYAATFPGAGLGASGMYLDLTTDLTQVVGQTSVVDTNNFNCIDGEFNDSSSDGTTNSYLHLVPLKHLFGAGNGPEQT